jgi:radical SAM superfamily enzyme
VPPSLLVAPHWGAKNQEIVSRITKAMKSRNTWQGRCRLQEA